MATKGYIYTTLPLYQTDANEAEAAALEEKGRAGERVIVHEDDTEPSDVDPVANRAIPNKGLIMQSKQDGTGIPIFDAETEEAMKKLGPGGKGNSESMADAAKRGITPELAKQDADRAAENAKPQKKYPPANHDLPGPLDDA
jgi:hypothetical protein